LARPERLLAGFARSSLAHARDRLRAGARGVQPGSRTRRLVELPAACGGVGSSQEDSKMLVLNVFGMVHERKVNKKDGTEFRVRYQEAEILKKNKRPRVVEIASPTDRPYEEGLYTVDSQSFHPDRFERLEMVFPKLTPLEDAMQVAEEQIKARKARKLT
jgi:hypothetical protein